MVKSYKRCILTFEEICAYEQPYPRYDFHEFSLKLGKLLRHNRSFCFVDTKVRHIVIINASLKKR